MIAKAIYSERNNPKAIQHLCRRNLKSAEFLTEAKHRVLNDILSEELRLTRELLTSNGNSSNISSASICAQAKRSIAEYYGITVRTINNWIEYNKTRPTLSAKHRSGRPNMISHDLKRRICEIFNEESGNTIQTTTETISRQRVTALDGTPYRTTYKDGDFVSHSPSSTSIWRVINEGKKRTIRPRPKMRLENMLVRYNFARTEMAKSDEERNDNIVAIDEAYFTLQNRGTGVLIEHPDGPRLRESQLIRQVKSKRHFPKIMVIAVIARPKILNRDTASSDEPAVFDPVHNGKVALVRCVTESVWKKNTYKTLEDGTKVIKRAAGAPRYVSCTLNGARYKEFLVRKNGIFDKIREYFGPNVCVRLQEDGAPGHGYNNRKQRTPTKVHDSMVAEADLRKIHVFKQPHNSPETNPLDLGIWHSLQSKVRAIVIPDPERVDDTWIEAMMWKACQQAWEELEPHKIWNCWMAREEILKKLKSKKGRPIAKVPHAKVRQRWGTYENQQRYAGKPKRQRMIIN